MHSNKMRTGRSLTVCLLASTSRGMSAQGVSSPRGSAPGEGVSGPGGVWSQGGVCSGGCLVLGESGPRGVFAPGVVCSGGCLVLGGWCLLRGVSQHALRQTPCGQNHRRL